MLFRLNINGFSTENVLIHVTQDAIDDVSTLGYGKISNISRTTLPNLDVSRFVVQLSSVVNPMRRGVKSRMKM